MSKVCVECGNEFDKLWSKKRCYWCSNQAYNKKSREQTFSFSSKKVKKSLKVKVDLLFSNYIKKVNMMEDGRVFCFTSLKSYDLKYIQAGHYFDRGYMRFRYDRKNVFPQSENDNSFKSGNLEVYKENLISLYGSSFLAEREKEVSASFKMDRSDMEILHDYYEEAYDKLELDPLMGSFTNAGQIVFHDGENYIVKTENGLIIPQWGLF